MMSSDLGAENQAIPERDALLRRRLDALSAENAEFWSFRQDDAREHVHAYFQYPAMMVPQMQSALINAVRQVDGNVQSVFDPFMGSGTILGEAMRLGLGFGGSDINPLAFLICCAKAGPFDVCATRSKAEELLERVRLDTCVEITVTFDNRDKWFRQDVAVALSKLRRAIQAERDLVCRRFLWVMLAETIRLTSNSRTDTVKLYARSEQDTNDRCIQPLTVFSSILHRNLENMQTQRRALADAQLLAAEAYTQPVHLHHMDARQLSADVVEECLYDLLVSSPPYGDNVTTVTYGQHSYLPLRWIPLEDIDTQLQPTWLRSTHEIDARSLGGSRKLAHRRAIALQEKSATVKALYEELNRGDEADQLGASRVAAFCHDLDACLDPMLSTLRPNAYMILTVGNRSVREKTMKLDEILTELLACRHVTCVHQIPRSIANKRQANRNKLSKTIAKETILILRKGAA